MWGEGACSAPGGGAGKVLDPSRAKQAPGGGAGKVLDPTSSLSPPPPHSRPYWTWTTLRKTYPCKTLAVTFKGQK